MSKNPAAQNNKRTVRCLNHTVLLERLSALNDTGYYIEHLKLDNLQKNLFISFKELTSIKKRIFSILNDSKESIDPIDVPFLKKGTPLDSPPTLSIVISSQKDLNACHNSSATLFFQLPNNLKKNLSDLIAIFLNNENLIPWFPSVLIGEDYMAAKRLLQQVQPDHIVTNNTGIAYEAFKDGIPWVAGPYLNLVNSFSLLCLKEKLNCHGAFISNEINRYQIKRIVRPENFNLYYSIYHPILLLTSRQCLFHQVIGCEKNAIDEDCMQTCHRSSFITNSKKIPLFIEKTKGNYPCIYNNNNFLNTDIVTDLPDTFSSFFIDLRQIKTETQIETDTAGTIQLFENLIEGTPGSKKELKQMIHPTTNAQYKKGI